ncbi:Glutamate receptor [Melia azedarach]|uniref:Glutamate receptor n=1 Tax=Melia azedarach TaxID=155640 RepID=A0ACC1XF38_MELAZ|nr:Glutamate receptor [Melia azedarach]
MDRFFNLTVLLLILLLLYIGAKAEYSADVLTESKSLVHIGAVFDPETVDGVIAEISINLAISDFYAIHPNYQTRLYVHFATAKDLVGTAAAVADLLKNFQVDAIIGPQISAAAPFLVELGEKAQVPIISTFESNPTLSPSENPYFIRVAQDDSVQVKAIDAVLQKFKWHEVVLVYEDSDYGKGFISYLIDALQDSDVRVAHLSAIHTPAEDFQISGELTKLRKMQTRVFIVYMNTALASRLFALADKTGMMSKGYAWIITASLSNSLNILDSEVTDSMEVFALAKSVERIRQPANPSTVKPDTSEGTTIFAGVRTSSIGPILRNEIMKTKFKGLSGEFHLVNGQLESPVFEIVNLIGKGRVVGYWTLGKGISQSLDSSRGTNLKRIIWPGDSTIAPIGWAIPSLKVGIPVRLGFPEFLNIHEDESSNKKEYSRFCIDVFLAVLDTLEKQLGLSIKYEFVHFEDKNGDMAGTYDDLLNGINRKEFNAVVGDITILANRTDFVDFTLPYTESGVTMLVPAKHDNLKNMWIFLKPWTWDLWLTAFIACIVIAVVIRIMEHRTGNSDYRGSPIRQLGLILMFPFCAMVIPQKELVVKDCSRFVLVIWLWLAFILMQSYTANLSSILTVEQLEPTYDDLERLRREDHFVGFQNGSYIEIFLVQQLNFSRDRIRPFTNYREYNEALFNGSKRGGASAIFEEIPYIRVFLKKYGSVYTTAGPIYRTDGFGFAFPKDSPLVSHFSKAILSVREHKTKMDEIERKYFGYKITSPILPPSISTESSSLRAYNFGGLFIIAGIATFLALVSSERYVWQKPVALARLYLSSRHPTPIETEATAPQQPTSEPNVVEHSLQAAQADDLRSSSQNNEITSTEDIVERRMP